LLERFGRGKRGREGEVVEVRICGGCLERIGKERKGMGIRAKGFRGEPAIGKIGKSTLDGGIESEGRIRR
jgi:hypothetical protein